MKYARELRFSACIRQSLCRMSIYCAIIEGMCAKRIQLKREDCIEMKTSCCPSRICTKPLGSQIQQSFFVQKNQLDSVQCLTNCKI